MFLVANKSPCNTNVKKHIHKIIQADIVVSENRKITVTVSGESVVVSQKHST